MAPLAALVRNAVAILGLAFTAAGCGSGGGSGGGGSTGSVQACNDACKTCSTSLCADCAKATSRYLPGFSGALYACVSGADACTSKTWEDCASANVGGFPTRSLDTSYRNACLSKRDSCLASQGSTFADDYCLATNVLNESTVSALQACLDKSCADAAACLGQVFS